MRIARLLAGLGGLVVTLGLASGAIAAPGGNSDEARAEHQRIVEFWTPERVARAVPRDFAFDPVAGTFVPRAKPVKPPVPDTLEPLWTVGIAERTTGKVLFQMGSGYYVCSASVVEDVDSGRSIVLTAAHCAYDETDGGFARNWMFIPSYDDSDLAVTADGSFCASTDFGCWTASALVVDAEYATAGGFNTQATQHDFAFAVTGTGGRTGTQLDAIGSHPITFDTVATGATTYALGFPAASPYDGNDLRHCDGTLDRDLANESLTYRIGCTMTGGASGGPWFSPFTPASGTGTLMSVNSYGYTRNVRTTTYDDTLMMFGPLLNGETSALYGVARTATVNTIL